MSEVLDKGICNVYFPSSICYECYLYKVCKKDKEENE